MMTDGKKERKKERKWGVRPSVVVVVNIHFVVAVAPATAEVVVLDVLLLFLLASAPQVCLRQ